MIFSSVVFGIIGIARWNIRIGIIYSEIDARRFKKVVLPTPMPLILKGSRGKRSSYRSQFTERYCPTAIFFVPRFSSSQIFFQHERYRLPTAIPERSSLLARHQRRPYSLRTAGRLFQICANARGSIKESSLD